MSFCIFCMQCFAYLKSGKKCTSPKRLVVVCISSRSHIKISKHFTIMKMCVAAYVMLYTIYSLCHKPQHNMNGSCSEYVARLRAKCAEKLSKNITHAEVEVVNIMWQICMSAQRNARVLGRDLSHMCMYIYVDMDVALSVRGCKVWNEHTMCRRRWGTSTKLWMCPMCNGPVASVDLREWVLLQDYTRASRNACVAAKDEYGNVCECY